MPLCCSPDPFTATPAAYHDAFTLVSNPGSRIRLPVGWLLPATTGDRYLICSDGLFSELPDDIILPLLAVGVPQQAADALVAAAVDEGGRDNVTVVVVDIDADDDDADETTLPREALPKAGQPGEGW